MHWIIADCKRFTFAFDLSAGSQKIGKSVRKYLSGETDIIYPTMTISSADIVVQNYYVRLH